MKPTGTNTVECRCCGAGIGKNCYSPDCTRLMCCKRRNQYARACSLRIEAYDKQNPGLGQRLKERMVKI